MYRSVSSAVAQAATRPRAAMMALNSNNATSGLLQRRWVSADAGITHGGPESVPEDHSETFTVRLTEDSFEGYDLAEMPSLEMQVTKKELLDAYYEMAVIRRLEQASDALYKAKKIRGFCHLSTGQEAVAVGLEQALTKEDSVITSYRCHGFAYIRGGGVKAVLAELLGRRSGISYGKGGSMHMFAPGFYGGNGIVGAQVPVGAGLAFAHKYNNSKQAAFILYGDGASNQGQVFEAYNMAKLWGLPAVFACENNKYGMGTSAERSSASTEYYKRGQYIPGLRVNAMDVLAVRQASAFAKKYTVEREVPMVMEYVTYRYGGHSMSDPGTTYRTRDEIQKMRSTRDPISGLRTRIINWGIADEAALKKLDKQAKTYVDAEAKEAEESPAPDNTPKILFEDIYQRGSEVPYLRGRTVDETYYY